jgi:hypothetical protein
MLRRLSRFECAFILEVLEGVFDGHAKLMNALCCGGRRRRPTVFRTHHFVFHHQVEGVWVYGVLSGYFVSYHGRYLTQFLFEYFRKA